MILKKYTGRLLCLRGCAPANKAPGIDVESSRVSTQMGLEKKEYSEPTPK